MIEKPKKEYNSIKPYKIEFNDLANDPLYCGSIKFYFSTYNTVNNRPDRMLSGCFDKELERWRNGDKLPRFAKQHDLENIIGVIDSIGDDNEGVYANAKYINTAAGKDAYIEVKTGAVDEFSFAWYCTNYSYDDKGVRNVLEVSGVDEISQVTYGMDSRTRPIQVNQKDLTIRDAEKALKNAGFSNNNAKKIVSSGFSAINREDLEQQRDVENNADIETLMLLNQANLNMKGLTKCLQK